MRFNIMALMHPSIFNDINGLEMPCDYGVANR